METVLVIGEVVVAAVTAQGLRLGARYTVEGMTVQSMPWGTYTFYDLRETEGAGQKRYGIRNGHLILRRA